MTNKIFIQNLFSKSETPVHFHAHFWGKFELIPMEQQNEFAIFAKATSAALEFKLSLKEEAVYLHEGSTDPILLTNDIKTLFQNRTQSGSNTLYDTRPSLTHLFTKEEMYKTTFRDPEDFEEIDAYVELIKAMDLHFDNLFSITEIQTKEEREVKELKIITPKFSQEIIITKELFDTALFTGLNKLLAKQGAGGVKLYLTIDPAMHMVILKLDDQKFSDVKRMGLLV